MEKSVATSNERGGISIHLPNDLLLFILSKLPLKSLKRFECVCKSWAFLFENPYFMRMYCSGDFMSCYDDTSLLVLQCTQQRVLHLLSANKFEKMVKLDWPSPFQGDNRGIEILNCGSVNGIFCLYQGYRRAVLWNPATKEFKVIPPEPVISLSNLFAVILYHGFGYDRASDDYKVIRCFRFMGPMSLFCKLSWEIYSLRSSSWKKLEVNMPYCHHCLSHESVRVYLDGSCHWLGKYETQSDDQECLVSFDLSSEVFFTTQISSDMDDFRFVQRHLVVLNGSIALVSNYTKTATFCISILGQVGVKESWTKLTMVGPLPCIKHPVGAGKKDGIFFRKKDDELVWIDLSIQKIEELGVRGGKIIIYEKSLLPIEGINN